MIDGNNRSKQDQPIPLSDYQVGYAYGAQTLCLEYMGLGLFTPIKLLKHQNGSGKIDLMYWSGSMYSLLLSDLPGDALPLPALGLNRCSEGGSEEMGGGVAHFCQTCCDVIWHVILTSSVYVSEKRHYLQYVFQTKTSHPPYSPESPHPRFLPPVCIICMIPFPQLT